MSRCGYRGKGWEVKPRIARSREMSKTEETLGCAINGVSILSLALIERIKHKLDTISEDINMLKSGDWIPDKHSCNASLDVINDIKELLKGEMPHQEAMQENAVKESNYEEQDGVSAGAGYVRCGPSTAEEGLDKDGKTWLPYAELPFLFDRPCRRPLCRYALSCRMKNETGNDA